MPRESRFKYFKDASRFKHFKDTLRFKYFKDASRLHLFLNQTRTVSAPSPISWLRSTVNQRMNARQNNLCNCGNHFSEVRPVVSLEQCFQCGHLQICTLRPFPSILDSKSIFYHNLERVESGSILARGCVFICSQIIIGIGNSQFGRLLLLLLLQR